MLVPGNSLCFFFPAFKLYCICNSFFLKHSITFNFYYSIVALQCCVSFCLTAKWNRYTYTYTYIPSFFRFPSQFQSPQSNEQNPLCCMIGFHLEFPATLRVLSRVCDSQAWLAVSQSLLWGFPTSSSSSQTCWLKAGVGALVSGLLKTSPLMSLMSS